MAAVASRRTLRTKSSEGRVGRVSHRGASPRRSLHVDCRCPVRLSSPRVTNTWGWESGQRPHMYHVCRRGGRPAPGTSRQPRFLRNNYFISNYVYINTEFHNCCPFIYIYISVKMNSQHSCTCKLATRYRVVQIMLRYMDLPSIRCFTSAPT